jgi:pimeloyl-ACP methyl ester carboxylesterase
MKIRILVFVLLFCTAFRLIAQNRDILWLFGPSLTSAQWTNAKLRAQANSYDFNSINITPYDNNTAANNIPDWAAFFNTKLNDGNHTDVLGIGHDAGGLIIRYMDMAQENGRLSAMILDGTPNQGAGIFNALLPSNPSNQSEAQRLINKMLNLRTQAQNCNGCQMIQATQSWVNYFAGQEAKNYYQQLKPTNPVITNLEAPGIPFAVIWGNEDDDALTLTRTMNSWYNAGLFGEDDEFVDCYRSEIEQRVQLAGQQFALGTMQSIAQYAGAAAKYKITEPQSISTVIEATLNALVTQLRTTFALSNELREIAECELVHQAMNAQWNLMLSPYNVVVQENLEIPCFSCETCETETDQQVAGYCWSLCVYDCDPVTGTYTQSFTYLTYEPHDGLLRKSEQLLAGAAKTYEAKGVNHFQEQFWEYAPIGNAFQDLFNGGAGAAFVVPK